MKILRRRQWHPTPELLPGKSHGWRSLVGCSPWGCWGRTWLSDFTFTFHFHALEKEMATHSSVLAWRIPGTGEPGGLPTMGSHRVGYDWSDLAAAAAAAWRFWLGKNHITLTQKARSKVKGMKIFFLKNRIRFVIFICRLQNCFAPIIALWFLFFSEYKYLLQLYFPGSIIIQCQREADHFYFWFTSHKTMRSNINKLRRTLRHQKFLNFQLTKMNA